MKKIFSIVILFTLFFSFYGYGFAISSAEAIEYYSNELVALGLEKEVADEKAVKDVGALTNTMMGSQNEVSQNFEALKKRVDNIPTADLRRDDALSALTHAEDLKNIFLGKASIGYVFLQESIGGAPPKVLADTEFTLAQDNAEEAQVKVNRILINPSRPGAVPEGDLVSDFIPQIIRQLFRFAWIGVLIAFTVSGVMLIVAQGNDERITKAKTMIYFSFIGFAFITLAFAIVKAVTDIDFFRFI